MDALTAWNIAKEKLKNKSVVIDALDCGSCFAFAAIDRPLGKDEFVGCGMVCVDKETKNVFFTPSSNRALLRGGKQLPTEIFNKTK